MPISSERTQQLINIALLLLKSHNPQAIHTFKDFLTFVPSPHHIRKILIIAVSQLVETEPETIYWLLQHPECLQPELNIKNIVAEKLCEKLLSWGYKEEICYFNADGNLEVNEATKQRLLADYASDDYPTVALIRQLTSS